MTKILNLVGVGLLAFMLMGCERVKTEKVYWEDGKTLRAEYSYIEDDRITAALGVCDVNALPQIKFRGKVKCYYKNGQLREEEEYADDGKGTWMNVGIKRGYYENGQMSYETQYNSKGKTEFHKTWYENGQLETEESYKDGKKDGVHKRWRKNGELISEKHYKNGEELK